PIKQELSKQNSTTGVSGGTLPRVSFKSGRRLSTFSFDNFQPLLVCLYTSWPSAAAAFARFVACEPPIITAASTEPVLSAEYMAGLIPLLERLGSVSLPASLFLFSPSSSEVMNFFSS
ncbi:MAG: hypothetical protein ACK56I_09680, partial [bacterium]